MTSSVQAATQGNTLKLFPFGTRGLAQSAPDRALKLIELNG